MSESNPLEFNNSQEQLEAAALINRFGSLKFEEFNPDIHVQEARKIIKAFDPRIHLITTDKRHEQIRISSKPKSTIIGATDLGEVKATIEPFDKQGIEKKVVSGKEEIYRIGSFMVTKINREREISFLQLKHFWEHSESNYALGKFPPFWEIGYNSSTFEPTVITEMHANVQERVKQYPFAKGKTINRYINYDPKVAWQSLDQSASQQPKKRTLGNLVRGIRNRLSQMP